jgi:hypothetical protein
MQTKAKEMKSDPSYVSSPVKKPEIVLQACLKYKRVRVSRLSITT